MSDDIHYKNVVGGFFDQCWAMMPEALVRYTAVVSQWSVGIKMDKAAVDALVEARAKPIKRVDGKVVVLPLFGVVAQRMDLFSELSGGGTSTERFGRDFDKAMRDDDVDAIVLNIDSPGGSVYGVQELADKIYEARGKKKTYAIANSLAASAAYHIGAAADQFYVTPSGEAGSIGVFSVHVDRSKMNEQDGVDVTYISAGKYKVEMNPDNPLTDEARTAAQASVDEYYDAFVANVARFRGVKEKEVRNGFGEGRVVSAQRAVEEGMADRVMTLESLLSELGVGQKRRKSASQMRDERRNKGRERIPA